MTKLTLLRHGQSIWNRTKKFTGWTDVHLTSGGVAEARRAGEILRANGLAFDVCFTSFLSRSIETLRIVLETMNLPDVPVRKSWRLNERHYGALQGLSQWQAIWKFGPRDVLRCQRVFGSRPPLLDPTDERFPGRDPLYRELRADEIPRGESVRDTLDRVRPYWEQEIEPEVRRGRRVLLVAHRNTLRALVKMIEGLPDAEIGAIKVPTGRPIVYDVDEEARPLQRYELRGAHTGGEGTLETAEAAGR